MVGAAKTASQAPLCGPLGPLPAAGLPLAQPTDSARPGAEYRALGAERPPPPRDPAGTPIGGGGGSAGGEPQWLGIDGAGWAATPSPLPSASSGSSGGSATLDGRARGRAPNERRFFRDIARADGVPGTARPPPPLHPRGRVVPSPGYDGVRPTGVVAEHGPRLGNVVGKKCPMAIPM